MVAHGEDAGRRRKRPVTRALESSLLPLAILTVTITSTRTSAIDDAYISFRYAANLSAGRGLVFNPGQHVEGISNLLWTLVLAGLHELGMAIPFAALVLGGACLVATVVLTRRIGVRHGLSPLVATAVAAGVGLTGDLVASSTVGLEGGMYAALLLAAILLWDGSSLGFASCVVALAATRPEGLVVGAMLVITRLIASDQPLRTRLTASAAALVGIAVLELGRFGYYHEFLPMSVTAKRDIGSSIVTSLRRHAANGRDYLTGLLRRPTEVGFIVGLMVVLDLLRGPRARSQTGIKPILLPLMSSLACGLGLPLLTGGDWMPHWRLVTPYVPELYLVLALVLATVGTRIALVAAASLPLLLALAFPASVSHRLLGDSYSPRDAAYDNLGRALEGIPLQNQVVASDVLGRMSYFAPDVVVSDMYGLTEPRVAKAPGLGSVYGKTSLPYTLSLHPAVIVTNYWPRDKEVLSRLGPGPEANPYVAVTSPAMSSLKVFVLARQPQASELARSLTASDPAVTLVSTNQALMTWSRLFPRGF